MCISRSREQLFNNSGQFYPVRTSKISLYNTQKLNEKSHLHLHQNQYSNTPTAQKSVDFYKTVDNFKGQSTCNRDLVESIKKRELSNHSKSKEIKKLNIETNKENNPYCQDLNQQIKDIKGNIQKRIKSQESFQKMREIQVKNNSSQKSAQILSQQQSFSQQYEKNLLQTADFSQKNTEQKFERANFDSLNQNSLNENQKKEEDRALVEQNQASMLNNTFVNNFTFTFKIKDGSRKNSEEMKNENEQEKISHEQQQMTPLEKELSRCKLKNQKLEQLLRNKEKLISELQQFNNELLSKQKEEEIYQEIDFSQKEGGHTKTEIESYQKRIEELTQKLQQKENIIGDLKQREMNRLIIFNSNNMSNRSNDGDSEYSENPKLFSRNNFDSEDDFLHFNSTKRDTVSETKSELGRHLRKIKSASRNIDCYFLQGKLDIENRDRNLFKSTQDGFANQLSQQLYCQDQKEQGSSDISKRLRQIFQIEENINLIEYFQSQNKELLLFKKFYDCLQTTIKDCMPYQEDQYKKKNLSLKFIWKWLKNLMKEYMKLKKINQKNQKQTDDTSVNHTQTQELSSEVLDELFLKLQQKFHSLKFETSNEKQIQQEILLFIHQLKKHSYRKK